MTPNQIVIPSKARNLLSPAPTANQTAVLTASTTESCPSDDAQPDCHSEQSKESAVVGAHREPNSSPDGEQQLRAAHLMTPN
jgi:hypothetical protein